MTVTGGAMRERARAALQDERRHLAPGLHDLHRLIGRGAAEVTAAGVHVELSDGRTVIDFGSYAVTLLGHRPPAVVNAVRDALDRMTTATRLLPNPTTSTFAARLAQATAIEPLKRVVIGLNGSDVVEAALKLAIAATGVPRVVAVDRSFHGKTLGALAVTWDPERRAALQPLLGHVTFVEPRADAVAETLAAAPAAAVIVEPVQGEGGGRAIPEDVLRRWCADAHESGALVIADEIQVGLRRCGPMTISGHLGLDIDAVLFGKPLGGGVLPLSAMVGNDRIYQPLVDDPFFHTSTFGGHPLSCAAGIAALEVLDGAEADVTRVGALLTEGMATLEKSHAALVDAAWSVGAFGVVRCHSADIARTLLLEVARRGVLLAPCLTAPDTLRALPPLVADDATIISAFELLHQGAVDAAARLGIGR